MSTTYDQINQVKSFDVVFIGHLASITAYLFSTTTKDQYKSLLLISLDTSPKQIIEPSLLPIYSEQIKITKKLKRSSIYHKQLKIHSIKPIAKQIELEGGKTYDYKYLVYSGNLEDWINYEEIKMLDKALSNQYSLVYSNVKKRNLENIEKLKQINDGNIVFYIPNGKHFGYDNFNFLSVYHQFIKTMEFSPQQDNYSNITFKIFLQGTQFFPYCKDADQFIKKQIHQKGIQVFYNSKLTKIDYLRRTLTINNANQVSYNILYCIIPQRVPLLLQSSSIDPYNNNPKTLLNKKYRNIFVIGGDIYPTTHTFEAIQYQNRLIARNLQHLLQKSGQISLYNGRTLIPIYITCKQIIEIKHFYDKSKFNEYLYMGQDNNEQSIQQLKTTLKQKCSLLSYYFNKLTKYYLTQSYYNYSSTGSPYYIFTPIMGSIKLLHEHEYQKNDQTSPNVGNNRNENTEMNRHHHNDHTALLDDARQIKNHFNRTTQCKGKHMRYTGR